MRRQSRFDFTDLNSEPSHLDLRIQSSEKLDLTVRPPAPHIACSIKSRPTAPVWIAKEALGCQFRASNIPAADDLTANENLTRNSAGRGFQIFAQHVDLRVGYRCPYRRQIRPGRPLWQLICSGHVRLRRTIVIVESAIIGSLK